MKNRNQNITMQLNGRLGNQMFQYAFGRAAQEKSGGQLIINFYGVEQKDKEFPNQMWGDSLQFFNTVYQKETMAPQSFWRKYLSIKQRLLVYLRGILGKTFLKESKYQSYENLSGMDKWIADYFKKNSLYIFPIRTDVYDVGRHKNAFCLAFFEDEKLFRDIRPTLINEFTPKAPLREENVSLYEAINTTQSVCVTIRRGDYLSEKYRDAFFICDENYFIKGIEIIKQKINNPVFFFFSDDLEYAKEFSKHVMGENDQYFIETENNPVWEKLRIMSACKHFVISNSTFSWWCQYLSNNDEKIVIGPKKWNNNSENNSWVQDEWIKI